MVSFLPFGDMSPSHYANTLRYSKIDYAYLLLPWCEHLYKWCLVCKSIIPLSQKFASALKPALEDEEASTPGPDNRGSLVWNGKFRNLNSVLLNVFSSFLFSFPPFFSTSPPPFPILFSFFFFWWKTIDFCLLDEKIFYAYQEPGTHHLLCLIYEAEAWPGTTGLLCLWQLEQTVLE